MGLAELFFQRIENAEKFSCVIFLLFIMGYIRLQLISFHVLHLKDDQHKLIAKGNEQAEIASIRRSLLIKCFEKHHRQFDCGLGKLLHKFNEVLKN